MPMIGVENGVRLFVQDINPSEKRTVLFIHGWPVDHRMFEYQLSYLPYFGFRCVAVDLRGFGQSDRPWTGYDYDRLSDDIRTVIDTMRLRNIQLVGFSMGGAIAIRYMARHAGHEVSSLALVGAAAPSFTKRKDFPFGLPPQEVNQIIQQTQMDRPAMLEQFSQQFFARTISPPFKKWFQLLGLTASNHATIQCALSLRDEDLRYDLPEIYVPTGIFHGIKDRICPFNLAICMHQEIKYAHLIPFKNSGHGVFYDELPLFNQKLLKFLKESWKSL